jgi:hypothetical protein
MIKPLIIDPNYNLKKILNNLNNEINKAKNINLWLHNEQIRNNRASRLAKLKYKSKLEEKFNEKTVRAWDILQLELLNSYDSGKKEGLKLANLSEINIDTMEPTKTALYYLPGNKFDETKLQRISSSSYNS